MPPIRLKRHENVKAEHLVSCTRTCWKLYIVYFMTTHRLEGHEHPILLHQLQTKTLATELVGLIPISSKNAD